MISTRYPHVEYDSAGVAIIAGSATKVAEIILDHLAFDWDARQLQQRFPRLQLGQIHAALAYYYDGENERRQSGGLDDPSDDEGMANPDHVEIVQKLKCLGLLP